MKRYAKNTNESISASVALTTNKFNSSIPEDCCNVLEALECAMLGKEEQFERFCDIQFTLTSSASWTGKVTEYDEGYYIELEATRCNFSAFVKNGEVIRKPRNIIPREEYSVEGENGHVYSIRRRNKRPATE